jgi:hypothetical protein
MASGWDLTEFNGSLLMTNIPLFQHSIVPVLLPQRQCTIGNPATGDRKKGMRVPRRLPI